MAQSAFLWSLFDRLASARRVDCGDGATALGFWTFSGLTDSATAGCDTAGLMFASCLHHDREEVKTLIDVGEVLVADLKEKMGACGLKAWRHIRAPQKALRGMV